MKQLKSITIGNCTLYHGDCFEILPRLDIAADAVISDPPYNSTACDWDVYIPLAHFWDIVSAKSKAAANYVFFAAGRFMFDLAASKYKWYRYDLVWAKNNKCGFLNANKQPMRQHENILVFGCPGAGKKYNPQKTAGGRVYAGKEKKVVSRVGTCYPTRVWTQTGSDGYIHPGSVLQIKNENDYHPTQKPLALMQWLIKSYSSENDTVIDPFMGSGSTGVACAASGRKFIGIEKEKKYFDIACKRIKEEYEKTDVSSAGLVCGLADE
ncbi:MAG: site-specific DNA-methyltransferase, partial [Planctomycetaceae bacterium]|nr:site-specific DNA-methyltransferase [Planctomycetaceae bacterium]